MGKIFQLFRRFLKQGVFLRAFLAVLILGVIAVSASVTIISLSPATGTQGADFLRSLLGPQPVADMESVVFTIQDVVHHAMFVLEGSKATAPWQVSVAQGSAPQPPVASLTAPTPQATPTSTSTSVLGKNVLNAPAKATPTPDLTPSSTATPIQNSWMPASVPPMGNILGEGQWDPFIMDGSGNVVAYRTFVAPDPSRPYAVVAVVALNLASVQLHYQLGTQEPVSPGRDPGTGQIPPDYLQPGILLGAFNGGFKTVHGHYGVMVDGNVLVPMIDGIATLAIYRDGSIRIGEWGFDLVYTSDMIVARQNCPLMVQQGQLTPQVFDNSISLWGGNIKGNIVTFRSGIGISQDGKTLYYFAGNYLSQLPLAKAMLDAGAYQAMQLDINNYYVLFTSFEAQNGKLVTVPLLPKEMVDNVSRFLGSYIRDFFYLTTK